MLGFTEGRRRVAVRAMLGRTGGTGPGLNIAYNIVTSLLGGTIRVESTAGHGAAFILDLPIKTQTRTPA